MYSAGYIVNGAKRDVQYRLNRYPLCSIQAILLTVIFGADSFANRDVQYKLYYKTVMFSRAISLTFMFSIGYIANREVQCSLYS
jgi:hypothetical protein